MTNDTAIWSGKLVFFLGVNTGFVSDREPDGRYIEFYRNRSSPMLHCAIVGNVVVPSGHGSNESTPFITTNSVWSELANAISEKVSLPGVQLATAWEGYQGARNFLSAEGGQVIEHARKLVSDLGAIGIEKTLGSFKAAAGMAINHGFRHIQLHAAHGYLLSLLTDERINPRADLTYDLLSRIATWLRSQCIETSLRISLCTGDDQFDANHTNIRLDRIAALPFDFVDLSSGFYNINKRLIYPSLEDVIASRITESVKLAERHPTKKFIFSGRISRWKIELPRNAHVGICRDLIANPNFLSDPERGCRNHSKCHYFSRGEKHIECPQWNETDGQSS